VSGNANNLFSRNLRHGKKKNRKSYKSCSGTQTRRERKRRAILRRKQKRNSMNRMKMKKKKTLLPKRLKKGGTN